MIAVLRSVAADAVRRVTYPSNTGRPVRRDPTHGRIDRDIQWKVHDYGRAVGGGGIGLTTAQRVVLENNQQQARDKRTARGANR